MFDLPELALVACGGVLGGLARHGLSGFVGRWVGETFPWGTLAVNASGALAIGLLFGLLVDGGLLWVGATAGILGSYTTVSSFSLQTLALARDGEWRRAAVNVVGSLVLCLAAVTTGFAGGQWLAG